jgi:hypothetical protein
MIHWISGSGLNREREDIRQLRTRDRETERGGEIESEGQTEDHREVIERNNLKIGYGNIVWKLTLKELNVNSPG